MSEEKNIEKMILHVERIITNLNQHWQSIQLLLGHVSKPLLVDDRGLRSTLGKLTEQCEVFINKTADIADKIDSMDIVQVFSEIKYIGKRLNEIEMSLDSIKKEGITQKIKLDFVVDGYELVKKPIGYDPKDPIEEPDENLKLLLDTLTSKQAKALIHRFGLFGEKKKTFKGMTEVLGLSIERWRQICAKSLRIFRHPSRRDLVNKINHSTLKKAITGECE